MKTEMKVCLLALLGFLAYVVVCIGGAVFFQWTQNHGVEEFAHDFGSVEPGMSRAEVIELLGQPDQETAEFRLGQREGFEHEYERADRSDSTRYLLWYKGMDLVFTIGFDDHGKVTMTACGNT